MDLRGAWLLMSRVRSLLLKTFTARPRMPERKRVHRMARAAGLFSEHRRGVFEYAGAKRLRTQPTNAISLSASRTRYDSPLRAAIAV
jgi:hypothetical protein